MESSNQPQQINANDTYISLFDGGVDSCMYINMVNSICHQLKTKQVEYSSKFYVNDAFNFSQSVRPLSDRLDMFAFPIIVPAITQDVASSQLLRAEFKENRKDRFNASIDPFSLANIPVDGDRSELFTKIAKDCFAQREYPQNYDDHIKNQAEYAVFRAVQKSIMIDTGLLDQIACHITPDGKAYTLFTGVLMFARYRPDEKLNNDLCSLVLIAHTPATLSGRKLCSPFTFQAYHPSGYKAENAARGTLTFYQADFWRQTNTFWQSSRDANNYCAKLVKLWHSQLFPHLLDDKENSKFKQYGLVCEVKIQLNKLLGLYFDNEVFDFDHYSTFFSELLEKLLLKRKNRGPNRPMTLEDIMNVEPAVDSQDPPVETFEQRMLKKRARVQSAQNIEELKDYEIEQALRDDDDDNDNISALVPPPQQVVVQPTVVTSARMATALAQTPTTTPSRTAATSQRRR